MNAIEMAQKYLNNVENNRKNRISSVISNDKRSLDEIVNTYINNYSPKYTSEDYKNIYKNELKKQKDIRKDIDTNFANQGVQTNTGYFTTQRNILPVQQQTEFTKNKKFEVYDNALEKNKEIEQKFQNIKNSDEHKKQEKNLIEQSNKVAYSKYDYDKSVVGEDNIGWYDKSIGTVIQGANSVFDISGGLVKNENGDNYFLPNKTELKHQKVQDSYDSKFGKLLGNVGYEIGRIGSTTAINQVLPGVGSSMYFGRMFMDSTNNAISEGYDSGSAMVYGAVNTATEYLVGKVLGSATKGLTGGKTNDFSNAISNTVNKLIKNPKISNIIGNAGSEATEEFVQEYLDNINKLAILEKSTNLKDYGSIFSDEEILQNALYSAGVGAITGGVFEGVSNTDGKIASNNTKLFTEFKNQLEESKKSINDVETIKKYDDVINSIDEYLKKPFGNEEKAEKILPTVEDIVKQESNVNNDYEIKKRSMSPTSDAFVAPNRTSKTDGAFASDNNSNTNIIENQEKIIKYTNHEIENFKNGKVKIATNPQDVSSFVESAKKVPSNAKLYFGKIGKTIADKIKSKLGIEIENYNISLKADSIKHILSHHSSNKESLRGQVPIVETDFNLIPEIVSNYDSVEESGITPQGKPVITFKKQIGDVYYLVNYVSNKNHNLEVQTMYKQQKKNSATASNANIPRLTSETDSGTSSLYANNIPQSNQNVKSDISSTINNMQKGEKNTINMPPVENKKVSKRSKEIAKNLNESMRDDKLEVKQRKWIDTALESEVAKDEIFLADLDFDKISYVVQSNKKTLDSANSQLNTMGYEESAKYIQSKINDNNVSLTDIALAERLIQEAIKQGDTGLASELIMDTAIIGTDLGQKVQALSLIQRLTPEGQLKFYQKLVTRAKVKGDKSFQNVEITPEMVELILNAYNSDGTFDQNDLNDRVEQFKGKIAEQLVTTKSEKLVAWRYLSMLGNPKTHIRNFVSNAAMMATMKVKNAVFARTLETVLPVKNRTKTWEKASKEVSDYARKTTEEMKNVITGESKYNEKTSIERKKQTFNNKTLEKIKDFNSDMLSKEDWLFSSRAFESSFREYLTAQGIKTNEDIANNTEIIEKAKLYAIEQSEIATFRQYSWLANQISKIENKNLATKLVVGSTIPFKKTPINVAKTGVKYSPIGFLKTISYDAYQVSKGNMEASQFIDNLSQGLTGISLTLIGYALAKAGLLKGASDDDKEGKYDSYLGNQTYSIKIGDSTYSISWLSPVAMPLLVGATAYEKLEEQSDWDMNVLVDTLAQTLDPLSEMSFLSSLDDILSSYDSGVQKFAGMAGSMAQNYLTQFIPTLFSQMASTLDDKKRSTRASNDSPWKFGEETVRKVMYKLPILRNQLEVSTDIWGNEQEQSDNIIERAFENFIAPYSKKEDISTSLDDELKRLYNSTGETSVIPGVPKAYVKYKDVTYQMSAKEYTEYKKTYGNTANTYLTKLVENDNYINTTDEQKANMVKEVYSYASALANEEYFGEKEVNYENDTLKEIHKIMELNMSNTQIAEYVAQKKIISSIKSNEDLTASEKKKEISEYLINVKLNDKQLAYLYDKYYSSEKVLDSLLSANIPIKEYIKFNSQEFTTDYYDSGKAVTNSRKNKVINYVNSLNLTIPQKAMLIKLEYSSYTSYDNQIVNYINNMKYSKFEKASILKSFGFGNYDKYLIDYVNKMSKTKNEKTEILENMGFTIRNGKVYS